MKLLSLLFLAGLALVSAVPVPSHDLSVEDAEDLALLFNYLEADDTQTELGKKLREGLDDVLEKIKDAVEKGKGLKGEYLEKLKEIREKLRDMKQDIGAKAKELLQKIKEEGKNYFKQILEKLGLGKRDVDMHLEAMMADDDTQTELGKKLRERLDDILEKIKDAVEKGKGLKDEYLEKMKEVREKLRDLRQDIGEKAKELLKKIKEEGKNYFKQILEKLGLGKRAVDMHVEAMMADDDVKTELGKKLRERLDDMLEKLKDAVEKGKTVKEDVIVKMKEIREKLKEMKEDIGAKAKELLQKIKEEGKNYFKQILEKLGLGKRDVDMHLEAMMADDDIKTELGKKLRERLDEILQKVKDAIENGKTVKEDTLGKMKEIREKLRDLKEDIGAKAKELLQKIKEEGKNYFKQILEKLGLSKRSVDMHVEAMMADEDDSSLKQRFRDLIEKVKDAMKDGKGLTGLLEKLKEVRENLKNPDSEIRQKIKEVIEKLRDRIKKIVEGLKEKREINFKDMLRKLREKLVDFIDVDKLREKIEEMFGKGSDITKQLREKLKDKGTNMKQRILDFIDRILEDKKEEKRSIKDVYEKVKEYLKNLKIELKEKWMKFGEWAKEKYEKGLQQGKDRTETLKKLAREFINDAKEISKEVAEQAKDFFQQHKDDLGNVYDEVKEKLKEIIKN